MFNIWINNLSKLVLGEIFMIPNIYCSLSPKQLVGQIEYRFGIDLLYNLPNLMVDLNMFWAHFLSLNPIEFYSWLWDILLLNDWIDRQYNIAFCFEKFHTVHSDFLLNNSSVSLLPLSTGNWRKRQMHVMSIVQPTIIFFKVKYRIK